MDKKQKKTWIITMTIMLAVVTLLCPFFNLLNPKIINIFADKFSVLSSKNACLVHFISVGNADATAVNLPDGKILLIDSGSTEKNVSYTQYLKEKVLNSKRNKKIDYLVLTHADADHIGGALKLLQNFDVCTIYANFPSKDTDTYGNLFDFINTKNYNLVSLNTEKCLRGENYNIKLIPPVSEATSNDACILVKLTTYSKSFLFTGDITTEAEEKLVELYGDELKSDVLKVAHHGSKTSSSKHFLASVSASYAVISCGTNSYGHPSEEVLNRLTNSESAILRTDVEGNILFANGKNYNMKIKTNHYIITPISLDYRVLILIIDVIIVISIIDAIIKKPKNFHLKNS